MRNTGTNDFVVVANRLPVDRHVNSDGEQTWRRSPGGLVSALSPVMRRYDGAWVGWTGMPDDAPPPFSTEGMDLVPVGLSAQEIARYYEGFSNATLWPLYHDVIVPAEFHREWWEAYRTVNQRFADAVLTVADEGAVVFVQDYQLQLVPSLLREQRPDLKIGFFLHIPFPPIGLFAQLPWRRQILQGLLGADLIGFQRTLDVQDFLTLVNRYVDARIDGDTVATPDGRRSIARAFPISIDVDEIEKLTEDPEVQTRADNIRHEVGDPAHILLGVDRLDYTKGIGHRLKAFGELLAEGKVSDEAVFLQLATPSRERVEAYQMLRDEIELQVGRLNGDFGRIGRPPVHYLHSSYERAELVALLRAADVMVVTPLRDGMNLVAKEYVAARSDLRGALVLSEFAGAADELAEGAFLVNPHDIEGMKQTLLAAMHLDEEEQEERMRLLRTYVVTHDIARWASDFLDTLRAM